MRVETVGAAGDHPQLSRAGKGAGMALVWKQGDHPADPGGQGGSCRVGWTVSGGGRLSAACPSSRGDRPAHQRGPRICFAIVCNCRFDVPS